MLIAKNIPKSYLWILPNSGHSTPIYYRDMFNQVIGDFFSKPYRKIEKWDVLSKRPLNRACFLRTAAYQYAEKYTANALFT
jgi:hypothetical protein